MAGWPGARMWRRWRRCLLAHASVRVREPHEHDALRLLAHAHPAGGGEAALALVVAQPGEVAEQEPLQVLEGGEDAARVVAARHRAGDEALEEEEHNGLKQAVGVLSGRYKGGVRHMQGRQRRRREGRGQACIR